MALYKLKKSPIDGAVNTVLKQDNPNLMVSIPFDSANTDYQEYLEWVAEGNTADAAD
tara:strand:+ start:372 stop:542 length:171 start_codon:yes stop_codon:yes gene_type:complete